MHLMKRIKQSLVVIGSLVIGVTTCMMQVYGVEVMVKEVPTKQSVEVFSDPIIGSAMTQYTIPGVVLTVVKDGEIIVSKGYGYADLENKIPVDPKETLFRIGSVTKLFTATVAMQLVDEGKVALDTPINEYIQGFKMPDDYETPVTLAHLLTHTSGLDDTVIGDLTQEASEVKSLTEFYGDYHWKSVREPGTIIQYNNRGMGAVGAIIEQVGKMDCKSYIEKNIFKPLQMRHTSLSLDEEGLSKGYVYNMFTKKIAQEKLEGYFNVYPVGGIVSTGEDMAQFMMAHLNEGSVAGKKILTPQAAQQMSSRQVGFNEYLPGNTYGFHERYLNGLRIIEHGGYSPDGFLTELALIPEQNIGIFISINQGSNNTFPQDYIDLFVNHYFQSKPQQMSQQAVTNASAEEVAGTYRGCEHSETDLCKADLIGAGKDVTVKANEDGSITVTELVTNYFDLERHTVSWRGVEVAPYTYQKTDDQSYIGFKKDSKGQVRYMSKTADSSMEAYERIHWYDGNTFQITLFGALLLLAFLEVLLWLGKLCSHGIKKCFKKHKNYLPVLGGEHLAGCILLLNLGFYVISMYTWGARMHYGVPLDVKLDLTMLIVAAALTPLLGAVTIRYWINRVGTLWVRVNMSMITVIGIIFVWFNNYWNFLGFNF